VGIAKVGAFPYFWFTVGRHVSVMGTQKMVLFNQECLLGLHCFGNISAVCIFFFMVLWFELSVSHLLNRPCTS
jgi:hypothetical protein